MTGIKPLLLGSFFVFNQMVFAAGGTIIMETRIDATTTHPTVDNQAFLQFSRDYASSPFQLTNVDADIKANVPAGLHWVRELPQIDYRIVGIRCSLSAGATSTFQTYNADNGLPGELDTTQFKTGDNAVAIQLRDGDTVECIFINERVPCGNGIVDSDFGEQCEGPGTPGCDSHCQLQGSIKIVKTFAACENEPVFEFTAPWATQFFLGNGKANESGFLDNGSYTVSEVNLPSDWRIKDISCVCSQNTCRSQIATDVSQANVTIHLVGPENIRCTFLNEFQPCMSASCAVCGNARREEGEVCDNGSRNSDLAFGKDDCTTQCKRPACGDGIVQSNEECDSGSPLGDSSCDSYCRVVVCEAPVCGNKIKEEGEQCDDGNHIDGDGCNSQCKIERCGDGRVNNSCDHHRTEECDDGEKNGGSKNDSCDRHCRRVRLSMNPSGSEPAASNVALTTQTVEGLSGCSSTQGVTTAFMTALAGLLLFAAWRRRIAQRKKHQDK